MRFSLIALAVFAAASAAMKLSDVPGTEANPLDLDSNYVVQWTYDEYVSSLDGPQRPNERDKPVWVAISHYDQGGYSECYLLSGQLRAGDGSFRIPTHPVSQPVTQVTGYRFRLHQTNQCVANPGIEDQTNQFRLKPYYPPTK
ncbi:uncharacterized protein BO95DRAFT_433915 [Aspergillus brunneoviolaceus CBS 621.78]|uniref:Uncharacterized protein n=1 Tax=Aspergillus brunneoviolaceus CBS 621.78 TaxID=1450534 RepID=A0ACD1G2H3_9EURO|nr:hypothetical protein BO95DRAFT_433915 [Aspergillus brunneoviolaceus CBS 621.78]RAH43468.1 hypothetical protein BO95DRAFT_433915 [Aspergillus brunneoviolaceus CBS 621.78]